MTQAAPETPEMIFRAGNLAILCVWGGRPDAAVYLWRFQAIMGLTPFEVRDPEIPQVMEELDQVKDRWKEWMRGCRWN